MNQSEMRIMALPQTVQTSKYDPHTITPCMSPLAMHRCQTPSGQNVGRRTNWRSQTKSTRFARGPLRGSDREGARSQRAWGCRCSLLRHQLTDHTQMSLEKAGARPACTRYSGHASSAFVAYRFRTRVHDCGHTFTFVEYMRVSSYTQTET